MVNLFNAWKGAVAMPEKIFTIPINEAFDIRDGCPLCRMREKLEEQTLESALGAAMMEPAIRIEMNREGFCSPHLQAMYRKKNKLALGLILESRLDELAGMLDEPAGRGKRGLFGKKEEKGDASEVLAQQAKSCYACKRIIAITLDLTIFALISRLWDGTSSKTISLDNDEKETIRKRLIMPYQLPIHEQIDLLSRPRAT